MPCRWVSGSQCLHFKGQTFWCSSSNASPPYMKALHSFEMSEPFIYGLVPASAGWTLTVASTNACPQQPPELEMRLSFPSCARQPGTSQSDSGLGEDNNGDKSKTQEQDTHQFLPPAQSAPPAQRWTLTVKNPGIAAECFCCYVH